MIRAKFDYTKNSSNKLHIFIPSVVRTQAISLLLFTIHVTAFMLILTLVFPLPLTCIDAVTGIPVVVISVLLGISIIANVVMVTVVVAFVVMKRKSGRSTLQLCL